MTLAKNIEGAFDALTKRAEAAEARVRELEARVAELEMQRDKFAGKEANYWYTLHKIKDGPPQGTIDLDQPVDMFRLACWRWCQEQARHVLSGSPGHYELERAVVEAKDHVISQARSATSETVWGTVHELEQLSYRLRDYDKACNNLAAAREGE